MHLSVLFLLALSVAVPSLGHNEQAYKNGYYFGRSADIVIDDASLPTVEVQLEWQVTKKQSNGVRANVTQIQDVHVYNLVSRALGLPQIQLPKSYSMETQMDDSVPFNFFAPPSGNVFFSIEGLQSETIPATTKALGVSPVYSLTQTARPYHPLAMLTTVLTGTQPRKHGVVNHKDLTSMSSNLYDVAKALYPETVVVSGSSGHCFASVLSAHKDSDSYYWDCETGSFVSLNKEEPTVLINKDNIVTFLGELGFSRKLSFQPGVEALVGNVKFDVDDKVDVTLFAEVAFVSAWSSFLEQSATHKFLSFHFRSLPLIAEKYGANSPQWHAAVELIDAAVLRSVTALRDCAFEIVYLPAQHSAKTAAMKSLVAPITAGHTAEETFPHIFLSEEGQAQQAELCNKARQSLSEEHPEVTVFCPLQSEERKRMNQDEPGAVPLAPVTANVEEVLRFHYVFWTHMILIVALLWATCAIGTIPPDESLYTASTFYKKGGKVL